MTGTTNKGEFLLVNKPKGWTSFDVVSRVRWLLGVKRVGHAGTLDPMATGLLILCTGEHTKEVQQFVGLEKEYRVEIMLGGRTETFDAESPVVEHSDYSGVTEEVLRQTLAGFTGHQAQLPPMWSAVKVHGKRLYKYARKGQEVTRTPREVFIRSIDLLEFAPPIVSLRVVCSKGTYVRTLVDDIGRALGCGAYVNALERTRIGHYHLSDAVTLDELASLRSVGVDPVT
jgi:tRNA pseudouridine55 synthase